MTAIAILFLILAIGCMATAWLANHGKLKWKSLDKFGFWGEESDKRKYKTTNIRGYEVPEPAPTTWYYKLFNLKYKERFPLSATFLVFATDGMHLSQAAYHVFLALSLSLFSGYSFFWFWPTIPLIHAVFYRVFQK